MNVRASARAGRRPLAGPFSRPLWRARLATLSAQVAAAARAVGSTVGAGLEGLLVGLVLGYLVAVAISAPGKYLGLPWPVECLLVGAGAAAITAAGAATAVATRRILLLVGRGVDRLAARIATPWGTSRVRRVAVLPGRALRALPVQWLGAFAAALLVANVGSTAGPLGLFLPAGSLGGYVILGGVVAAFAAAALHAARAGRSAQLQRGWRASARGLVHDLRSIRPVRRAAVAVLAGAAVATGGFGGAVLLAPGRPLPPVAADAAFDGQLQTAVLADPGDPGPYAVRRLSYGSGLDVRRPEFGERADLHTAPVDASPILLPLGWGSDEARKWFWGFGTDELPLNGLAWLPEGPGPFPLVLVVHGNHAMGDFSEPGYAYLGDHLASRGFITVSVDEDFLNGSWASDWGGTEQLARAWLLLLHLDQWRTWSEDPDSPVHGLVDLDRLALIGHSRGGEAASVAASLASRSTAPMPGLTPWPNGLRIRAVVAIAPSDGQYGGGAVVLKGTDFLTLHGGHDGDATSWMGIRQYARTVVDEGGFKAALWAYRANHGQFNTTWGRSDHGDLGGAILDLAPLQDPAAQEDVARTAIGAFLEASLHGQTGYRDLFRRPMVGREWLPSDDIYLVRSTDDGFVRLTSGDGARGVEGVTVAAIGFESSASAAVPLRSLLPDQLTRAVQLRWTSGPAPAVWALDGLDAVHGSVPPVAIRVSLANGSVDLEAAPEPLDLVVELATSDGVTVALPLSRWGALPPPLEVDLVKDDLLSSLSMMDVAQGAPPERVLQTYEIPLADYVAANPAFDPARLHALRLVIDRGTSGALWVAEVGLAE